MKKCLYSNLTKTLAVLLFLLCLTLGTFEGIRSGKSLLKEGDFTKDIGKPLEESYHFRNLLNVPENELVAVYWEFALGVKGIPTDKLTEFYEALRDRLQNHAYSRCIEFYIDLDGAIYSNAENPQGLREGFYKYYAVNPHGLREFYYGGGSYLAPDLNNTIIRKIPQNNLTIAVRISPQYAEEYTLLLSRQEQLLFTNGAEVLACALGLLLSLLYLSCVCGKNGKGEITSIWIDRIWVEFHLALAGGIAAGALYFTVLSVEAAYTGIVPMDGAYLICGALLPVGGGALLSCLLSMIRNLKVGQFARRCVLLMALKLLFAWTCKLGKLLWKGLRYMKTVIASLRGSKRILWELVQLLVFTRGIHIMTIYAEHGNDTAPLVSYFLLAAAAFILILKERDLHRIQKGVARIRGGEPFHRIPEPAYHYLKPLAEDINHIAMGLDASLAARIKAEQMKTELITNVSHDLKTPLTSIITYTELLSRVENLPEEARDYLRIIESKSQRLKSLTQDLFDISKVRSGTETVQWERLDAALLLEQSLAEENENEMLQFCLKTEENLTFMGDGQKLSRVLGNLLQNAAKYAMPGTRVFLSAYRVGNQILLECKNTSAYPLDFTAEEILGRFVRGDSARSTEGNGLGLPIAKSYTELCGGTFHLVLDGDLFKVLLSFPAA